jgi:hypothetical protein
MIDHSPAFALQKASIVGQSTSPDERAHSGEVLASKGGGAASNVAASILRASHIGGVSMAAGDLVGRRDRLAPRRAAADDDDAFPRVCSSRKPLDFSREHLPAEFLGGLKHREVLEQLRVAVKRRDPRLRWSRRHVRFVPRLLIAGGVGDPTTGDFTAVRQVVFSPHFVGSLGRYEVGSTVEFEVELQAAGGETRFGRVCAVFQVQCARAVRLAAEQRAAPASKRLWLLVQEYSADAGDDERG